MKVNEQEEMGGAIDYDNKNLYPTPEPIPITFVVWYYLNPEPDISGEEWLVELVDGIHGIYGGRGV